MTFPNQHRQPKTSTVQCSVSGWFSTHLFNRNRKFTIQTVDDVKPFNIWFTNTQNIHGTVARYIVLVLQSGGSCSTAQTSCFDTFSCLKSSFRMSLE